MTEEHEGEVFLRYRKRLCPLLKGQIDPHVGMCPGGQAYPCPFYFDGGSCLLLGSGFADEIGETENGSNG